MNISLLAIAMIALIVGCCIKIGEAIGVCIGDQIKYRYVLWRDKKWGKNEKMD
ncbi:Uncharacterised protein [Gallibacterium anatis]|uniref:Uncharacterized protein n=1 Tax=Gallibacterium anatis TaxID=750 RepID=A0A377H7R5_9PAST|nr:hypothetical protein [Gallibacterium anatis]STO38157.1 Uncharacterised protein [Gallibacterium anatis]